MKRMIEEIEDINEERESFILEKWRQEWEERKEKEKREIIEEMRKKDIESEEKIIERNVKWIGNRKVKKDQGKVRD